MNHRPEIDGLRALAVVPVVLFHAGLGPFPGGFVGVDVFFVLSGYLITTILIAEIGTGRFSLLRFYERRARRILPALFLVMLCCVPFAWALMTPTQYEQFGRSLVAVVLFASNLLFWMESGYFTPGSELKPLLHTWSLAVEEQFYLLFPPLLALLWRRGPRVVVWSLVLCALASLALAEWGARTHPTPSFYLALTRGWELLAGALAALWRVRRGPQAHGPGALAGLALILGAMVLYDGSVPFPGLYALVPVLGTVLVVLCAAPGTRAGQLLALRPVVAVGLVSYSAYLWHQPLLAFARLGSLTYPTDAQLWALCGLTFGLAGLTWALVEQPFRSGRVALFATRPRVLASSALAGLGLAVIGLAILSTGRPALERAQPALFARTAPPALGGAPCPGFAAVRATEVHCLRRGDGPRTLVVWGDSHAEQLADHAPVAPNQTVYFIFHSGCPPGAGLIRVKGTNNTCRTLGELDRVLDHIVGLAPETVVLAARWTLYLRGAHSFGKPQAHANFVSEGNRRLVDAASSAQSLTNGVARAIARLQPASRVWIVAQAADLTGLSPRGLLLTPALPRAGIEAWHAPEQDFLATLAQRFGVGVVDSRALTCSATLCHLQDAAGAPLYLDDNHLSATGARAQWEAIECALSEKQACSSLGSVRLTAPPGYIRS